MIDNYSQTDFILAVVIPVVVGLLVDVQWGILVLLLCIFNTLKEIQSASK